MQVSIAELMRHSGVGFGTSGARGLVESMTDEICYLYVLAFLQHLEHSQIVSKGTRSRLQVIFVRAPRGLSQLASRQ
jgi:hypothetical protein